MGLCYIAGNAWFFMSFSWVLANQSQVFSTIGLVVLMLIWIDFGTELSWRLSSAFPMYSISPSPWAPLARSMGFNFTSQFLVAFD